jgi:DNA-binding transcriptional ArsR family regulator
MLDTKSRALYLTNRLSTMATSNTLISEQLPPNQLNATFAALADPTRRAILAHLMSGEASVTELAEPFAMSMPAISKHLKVLERAGLITRSREAQWRPSRIQAAPLKGASDWIENYRMAWESRLDRLHDYLHELKIKEAEAKKLKAKELEGKVDSE